MLGTVYGEGEGLDGEGKGRDAAGVTVTEIRFTSYSYSLQRTPPFRFHYSLFLFLPPSSPSAFHPLFCIFSCFFFFLFWLVCSSLFHLLPLFPSLFFLSSSSFPVSYLSLSVAPGLAHLRGVVVLSLLPSSPLTSIFPLLTNKWGFWNLCPFSSLLSLSLYCLYLKDSLFLSQNPLSYSSFLHSTHHFFFSPSFVLHYSLISVFPSPTVALIPLSY